MTTSLDTDYFLQQVKLKATLPLGRFEDSEILDVAWDKLINNVVPFINSMLEEYYVATEDQTITANQKSYPIPYRSMGLSVRSLFRLVGERLWPLEYGAPDRVEITSLGTPRMFYPEAQNLILYPTPASTGDTLRIRYPRAPNRPVTVAECAQITAIDLVTGILTATPPTTWTTADDFDIVSKRNGHRVWLDDLTAVAVGTTTITFTAADLSTDIELGDYVCLAGESAFLEVPDQCFNLMIRETMCDLLDSMGDQAAVDRTMKEIAQLRANIQSIMAPRIVGKPRRSTIRTL